MFSKIIKEQDLKMFQFLKCAFKQTTGLYCAGCGSTRAAHALVHFDVSTAFRKNPLLVILLPLLAVGIVLEGLAWLLKDRYRGPRVRLPGRLAWVLVAVVLPTSSSPYPPTN